MLDNWVKSAEDSVLSTEWHYYDNPAVKPPSTLTFFVTITLDLSENALATQIT